MSKVYIAKIVGAHSGTGYTKDIGKTVEVKKFTHNFYLDAHNSKKTYNVKDLRIIREIKGE